MGPIFQALFPHRTPAAGSTRLASLVPAPRLVYGTTTESGHRHSQTRHHHGEAGMSRQRLAIPSCLICLLLWAIPAGARAGQPDQATYANSKYGYAITYPAGVFAPQGEADSGDGQVFLSRDGQAELRVFAAFNVLDETLEASYRSALASPGLTATYRMRRLGWYVVSGYQDGRVHYQKTILAQDTFFTLLLTYAPAAKAVYDPLVGTLVQGFVIF
jgi:hypothetical protein